MQVAVIGAGSWGTAVANLVGSKQPVTLWARRTELSRAVNERRENPDYLHGYELAANITASSDLSEAVAGADAIVMGVPSHGYRSVLESLRGQIGTDLPILSLAKGVERESLMRMTEVTANVLPDHNPNRIGVLTGPNLAKEIAAGQPAATVIAMQDQTAAQALQQVLMTSRFRVYTNDDVIGSESAGALKNVMAIAAGMAHGLGFGDNTMAMLITRALAELTRLGVAMGGRPLTFAGLAGMGDLIATCMSSQSRNHTVGYGLGQGKKLDDIIEEMNQVAEGVKSTPGILALADRHGIEMPIATQVARVLYEGAEPLEAVSNLMAREAKPEMHGIA
jgi:glycerol-3-phosphate dehydrogenase (NAD(P)+)